MAQLSNITTAATAISCAPNGTKWSNGNFSLTKQKTPGGFKGSVYVASDGKKKWFLDASNSATFMNKHAITQANNPLYSIVKKRFTEQKKKPVTNTKGAPKKKTEKPKKEDPLDKPFDDSDILQAQTIQTAFDQANFQAFEDWRVRLSLAPGANYLYAGDNPGILKPLQATNGVVFPYTPTIQVSYQANYSPIEVTHSNYKVFQYSNSGVDSVTISCDFTAQDTYEARYLLAVIHFFKSMTKMFYGQDVYPIRGTPPPLCYMYGMGGYQFAAHPLAIRDFNYTLPNDVDYIQTVSPDVLQDLQITENVERALAAIDAQLAAMTAGKASTETQCRLGDGLMPGGRIPPPVFNNIPKDIVTYVPTKIQISIGCVPMMSRNQVSNYFSLEDYASGQLVKGTTRPGGGMW